MQTRAPVIADATLADLDALWTLNQSEVPHVGSVTREEMAWYLREAPYFRVVRDGDEIAAFLIGFGPGHEYTSPNYRWFCERYPSFAYVDRIAVGQAHRRKGLARSLYRDLQGAMPAAPLSCEVNIVPPNETSMRFHQRLGFETVGELASDTKTVAMLWCASAATSMV